MYKRNENNKQHENENIVKWAIRSTSESRECIIMIKIVDFVCLGLPNSFYIWWLYP